MAAPLRIRPTAPPTPTRSSTRADACYAEGLRHLDQRRVAEARQAFEDALRLDPPPERQAAILFALGNAARRMGERRIAEDCYDRVLALEPGRHEALVNLANLYRTSGRFREAELVLNDALTADPVSHELWLSLGQILREIGEFARARQFLDEALRLSPEHPPTLLALCELHLQLGAFDDAEPLAARATARLPGLARPRYLHALALLGQGRTEAGWPLHSARFTARDKPLRDTHGLPAWDGTTLRGKRLLLTAESDAAAELLFAGLVAPALRQAQASRVILQCDPRLAALFAYNFSDAVIRPAVLQETEQTASFDFAWLAAAGGADCALALGDLPRVIEAGSSSAPLRADPAKTALWQRWRAENVPGRSFGLSWRGDGDTVRTRHHFAPLRCWAELIRATPAQAICLQPAATPEEIAYLERESGKTVILPPGVDRKTDFGTHGALISTLDTMVSAPSAVAALSAALGVSTLKLTFAGSWTALGQDREPFAPAGRIVMPNLPGDWADVFAQARALLSSLSVDG